MANQNRALCVGCDFYEAKNENKGQCRVSAPRPLASETAPSGPRKAYWPEVRANDWCGEYRAKGHIQDIAY